MLPIVDTHLHFLDFSKFHYPWTDDAAWQFLKKGYLPEDWRKDVGTRRVLAGVHVQAEVDHEINPVEETQWLAMLDEPVAPMVYVGYADLGSPALEDVLDGHQDFASFRGIRQEAWFDPASTRADMPRENVLLDPAWRQGLPKLAARGLSFDLLVWSHQLKQAADVFAEVPELQLVVNHTGMPTLDDDASMQEWRDGLALIAERAPRSVLKISAMALFAGGWSTKRLRPIVLEAIDLFGPGRCMLASNFPVDSGIASYEAIWSGYETITEGLSDDERSAIFSGTALRTYRINTTM
jgi:predicted TIM-barrel fold metal-dependent hydrolase